MVYSQVYVLLTLYLPYNTHSNTVRNLTGCLVSGLHHIIQINFFFLSNQSIVPELFIHLHDNVSSMRASIVSWFSS